MGGHHLGSMILSAIDLGTNTVLMATVKSVGGTVPEVLGDEFRVARLGKGVDASGLILPATFDRVEEVLKDYLNIAQSYGADRIVGVGTSALRDARNRDEFVGAMEERTGLRLRILSGDEEARLTYRGSCFSLSLPRSPVAVIDIGGGSTEVALGNGAVMHRGCSLNIGAVRLSERFLGTLPARTSRLREARLFVRSLMADLFEIPADGMVVGAAGTVTTLGILDAALPFSEAETIHGYRLSAAAVSRLATQLFDYTSAEIEALGVDAGRADILPAGALILDEFMRCRRIPEIIVSTRGLRYGVVLEEPGL